MAEQLVHVCARSKGSNDEQDRCSSLCQGLESSRGHKQGSSQLQDCVTGATLGQPAACGACRKDGGSRAAVQPACQLLQVTLVNEIGGGERHTEALVCLHGFQFVQVGSSLSLLFPTSWVAFPSDWCSINAGWFPATTYTKACCRLLPQLSQLRSLIPVINPLLRTTHSGSASVVEP